MDSNAYARSMDYHSGDDYERSEAQYSRGTQDVLSNPRESANVLRIESDSELSESATEQYPPYAYSSHSARREGDTVTYEGSSSGRTSSGTRAVPPPSNYPYAALPSSSSAPSSPLPPDIPSNEEKRVHPLVESGAPPPSETAPPSSCPLLSPFLSSLQHRERNALRRQAALEAVATSDLSRLVLPDPDTPMTIVGLPPLPSGADAPPSASRGSDGVGQQHFPSSAAIASPSPAALASLPSPFPQDAHHVNSDALNSSEKKQLVKIVVDRALMAAAAENRRNQARQVILASSGGKLAEPYGPPLLPMVGAGGTTRASGGLHGDQRPRNCSAGEEAESSRHGTLKGGEDTSIGPSTPHSSASPSSGVAPSLHYALDIFHAACDGDAQMIAYNLYYGADVNAVGQPNPMYYDGKPLDKRWSFYAPPLVFAAAFGRERAVRALLSWGADVHGRSSTGLEAMDYAVKRGYSAIVSMLEEEVRKAEAKKPKIVLIRN